MLKVRDDAKKDPVALLAEGVDRNTVPREMVSNVWVALLAEGVDRNSEDDSTASTSSSVALLAEGVDRNTAENLLTPFGPGRPPRGGRG